MIKKIDDNLWVVEQPFRYFGLSVGNRMTIVRLAGGDVVVISPINIDGSMVEQINSIGLVKYIIAPNLYHHLFIKNFQKFYPEAQLWAVAGLEEKRPDLAIDRLFTEPMGCLEGELEYLYFQGFQTLDLRGFIALKEYVFYERASRTLILTDTAFYFDDSFDPVTRLAAKLSGGYQKLRPSQLEKIATREREAVKQSIQQVLKWDFDRVIVAHGNIVETGGKEQLKAGYEWFLNTPLD